MKQGTLLNKIVMTLFLLAILAYFAGAAWKGLRDPYPTVQAYAYSVDDTLEATGYLVRQEQVLSGSGGIVRLLPAEGEKVAAGTTVALLYADEAALERSGRGPLRDPGRGRYPPRPDRPEHRPGNCDGERDLLRPGGRLREHPDPRHSPAYDPI